jgi:uncharacterized protein
MNNEIAVKKERITSIDALRAVVLFGILLVHVAGGFGLSISHTISTGYDVLLRRGIVFLLSDRCALVFNVLFGISFYLILKNPNHSSRKFVWRCILLMLIGLFNKIFYTNDTLMLYGFWGIILTLFRNVNVKALFLWFCFFFVLSIVLSRFELSSYLFPDKYIRYDAGKSFYDVISYKHAVVDQLRIAFTKGIFGILSNFILGYCLGKAGVIDNLKKYVTLRLVIILFLCYIVLGALSFISPGFFRFRNISGAFFYALLFLYLYHLYNKAGMLKRIFSYLEAYGKCGLTNYSMQGILGVIFINDFGLGWNRYSFSIIVFLFVCLYVCQAILSYWWIKKFTYGPFEYLWRCAIDRKCIPFRKRY